MSRQRYTVFEAVNEKLREIFVGVTSEQMFKAISEIQESLPRPIKHWNLEDVFTVRSIEFNLDENEARAFVDQHVRNAPSGWRYLTEQNSPPAGRSQ